MKLKVIKDDGYILTLLRPCEMYPLRRGESVDVEKNKEGVNLNTVFDAVLTDELLEEIVKRVGKPKCDTTKSPRQ